jgi:hypothetical protein
MATRRFFIGTAGTASLAPWAILGSSYTAQAATNGEAAALRTLIRVARLIYPHDALSDAVYAGIVGTLLDDPQQRTVLTQGAADLDGFLSLNEREQLKELRAIEGSEFFQALKIPLMWSLYNTPDLWDAIGYPGPSFGFGGYINRGFNDIDWLPE